MWIRMFKWVVTLFVGALFAHTVLGRQARIVNLTSDQASAIEAALKDLGIGLQVGRANDPAMSGDVIIWEAHSGGRELSPGVAASIGEWVRQGGSLLLTIAEDPG